MPRIQTGRVSIAIAAGVLMLTASGTVSAAGFQLKEQSAQSQGNAFAGATATASDLSTIYFNPAGMTRLKGTAADMNLSYIMPSSKLKVGTVSNSASGSNALGNGNGGDAGAPALVPAFYGMYDYSNDLKFGLAVNTPFGLSTEYDDGWAGRYHALKSEIKTINVAPSVAYRVNNNLSVGAAAQIQYVEATLSSAVNGVTAAGGGADGKNTMTGDDIGFGGRLGLLYEFDDKTRVGAAWHSRIRHQLKGNLEYENLATSTATVLGNAGRQTVKHGITANLTTPDIFALSASHDLDDQWTLLGEVSRTQWTTFKELRILDTNGVQDKLIYQNYKASHFGAVGATYKYDANNTFRFGVAFDQGAVETEYRTARIPDADRYWFSVGYGYSNENVDVNLGYSYIKAKDATLIETDTGLDGGVTGTYDSDVNIFALNATWKF